MGNKSPAMFAPVIMVTVTVKRPPDVSVYSTAGSRTDCPCKRKLCTNSAASRKPPNAVSNMWTYATKIYRMLIDDN